MLYRFPPLEESLVQIAVYYILCSIGKNETWKFVANFIYFVTIFPDCFLIEIKLLLYFAVICCIM